MIRDLEQKNIAKPTSHAKINYTLKILFGPMFGCELHLTAEDYFIIINPRSSLQQMDSESTPAQAHSAHYTHNTLYIPCDFASPNILLRLSNLCHNDENLSAVIEIYRSSERYETVLHENEIFTDEHIRFSFKRSDIEWAEEIRDYNLLQVNKTTLTRNSTVTFPKKTNRHAIFFTSGLLVILLLIISVYWYKNNAYDAHVSTLSEVLSGVSAPFDIVKSRDNKLIFVLVSRLQEMEWVKEALYKLKEDNSVIPVWITQHKKLVIAQLVYAGYPVLQLDYSLPKHPVLAVYRQLTKTEEESLKSAVLKNILYASDVEIIVKTKEELLIEARNGLDSLNIKYRQINTNKGYGFIIRDALSDTILAASRRFIKDFELKWGNNIITFSIHLDENWLLNKSYIDSTNGYLFLNPRHWYFPLKSGDKYRE